MTRRTARVHDRSDILCEGRRRRLRYRRCWEQDPGEHPTDLDVESRHVHFSSFKTCHKRVEHASSVRSTPIAVKRRRVSLGPNGPRCDKAPGPIRDAYSWPCLVGKRGDTRLRATEDQRMDVMRAFVSVHDLEIDEMTDDTKLVDDAIAAEHVASDACDVERLAR